MVKENMDDPGRGATILKANGETFVEFNTVDARDQDESDEGGPDYDELPEGPRTIEERVMEVEKLAEADVREVDKIVAWEPEPPLTTDQYVHVQMKWHWMTNVWTESMISRLRSTAV